MSSAAPILSFIGVYLLIITFLAPKLMNNRKAYALTNIMRLYNVAQVISCAAIVMQFFQAGWTYVGALSCESTLEIKNYKRILEIWWFCIFIRCAEFLETIFFILRKKSGQVTFLHVYHHISSLFIVWIPLKYGGSK
jgi:elongation of very long chain fatty acids protein 7